MPNSDLVSAANQRARSCVLLKRDGPAERLAGIWGGSGVVPPPPGLFRHWLSIDCRFLPAGLGPTHGVLSVYTDEKQLESGFAGYDAAANLPVIGRDALYAHSGQSIPPLEAFGVETDDVYTRFWQAHCPLYSQEAVAVLGGWHFPWPDGDWEELRDQSLLLWTLDEAEPWVEVWAHQGGFSVMQRIT